MVRKWSTGPISLSYIPPHLGVHPRCQLLQRLLLLAG
jgi:hypothetical protein